MTRHAAIFLLLAGLTACGPFAGDSTHSNSTYGRTYGNGSDAAVPSDCNGYDQRPECLQARVPGGLPMPNATAPDTARPDGMPAGG